jgi:2-polyprenyl-6-methoxyphenol hydroxylase-like FAD-dependent oxidoreductase
VADEAVPPLVIDLVTKPRSFPLRVQQCVRYVGPRAALLGDAAHLVHPLAGQGVNLGFGDVRALRDVLVEARSDGQDLGALAILEVYERQRWLANAAVLAGVDSIQRLFAVDDGPLAALRSIGMDLFNATPALKREASRWAMGWEHQ